MKTYAKHGSEDYNSVTAAGCERDGEPVFTLRAQDIHAAETVRFWAEKVADPQMRQEALAIAQDMDAWPDQKEPD